MPISRYIVVAVVRCACASCRLHCAPVELAEAEVAVGDEGTHAARLGKGQGLVIVTSPLAASNWLGMGRDVAEQMPGMAFEPWGHGEHIDRAAA
jgi:hypothetical protein